MSKTWPTLCGFHVHKSICPKSVHERNVQIWICHRCKGEVQRDLLGTQPYTHRQVWSPQNQASSHTENVSWCFPGVYSVSWVRLQTRHCPPIKSLFFLSRFKLADDWDKSATSLATIVTNFITPAGIRVESNESTTVLTVFVRLIRLAPTWNMFSLMNKCSCYIHLRFISLIYYIHLSNS